MPKSKIVYLLTRCKNAGPIKQTANIIKYLDRERFEPVLITMFPEVKNDSLFEIYKAQNVEYHCMNSNKKEVLLNGGKKIKELLNKIKPDVVHSVGMAPYKLAIQYNSCKHLVTLRNYVYEDYPAKYGKLLGTIMATLDMRQIQRGGSIVTCSESLSNIYKAKKNIQLPFIRNGVDLIDYKKTSESIRSEMREKLSLPQDKKIAVYTGQFLERKNQKFAIEGILSSKLKEDICLVLIGAGKNLEILRNQYKENANVIFTGQQSNVEEYLQAADFYVSTSKSEGMPNGVLEAMAVGLPVLLSDILQHKEIVEINERVGRLYSSGNLLSFEKSLSELLAMDLYKSGNESYEVVNNHLNAELMSRSYQKKYSSILHERG
ncbi:glycosyltransferase [Bacillus sp. es.034]|uniref:glycosyltransferase n=1 Tax=Bacillus sp. es.034 TaxID=1761763 RepID=UPI000C013E87|nr:glycosyltransferase [Bacillus sp. es.034]PFG04476.1 glycosyltransferase involved in cell wall biosynthesis [Bacillus sp. es.034]